MVFEVRGTPLSKILGITPPPPGGGAYLKYIVRDFAVH